jgi:predicted nucleotidyltransferase component of viral defense system
MVELREARKTAAKIGLGLQYVLKEARVFDIWSKLSPIILSDEISSQVTIICKGGTVLSKVFLKGTQRFSEDLDFDAFFSKQLSKEEKIAFLDNSILSNLRRSYQIEKPRLMQDVVRFTCSFTNETGAKDCVFVEFNLEPRGSSDFVIQEATSELIKVQTVRIPIYSFPDLVAKKMKTFYERGSGKDLYDIYYSLKIVRDVHEIVNVLKEVLKAEKIEYDEFVKEFLRKLGDRGAIRRVHASTNPYVPRKLRVGYVEIAEEIEEKVKDRL